MTDPATLQESSPPPAGSLLRRAFALLALLVLFLLWSERHLGMLAADWAKAPLFVVVSAAWAFLAKIVSDAEQKAWQSRLRGWAEKWVLAPRTLAMLYMLAALVFLLVSSVTVIVEDADRPPKLTLVPAEETASKADPESWKGGVARVPVWVNPLGRDFRLSLATFQTETVTVYPVIGLRVNASRDLRRAPTLVVRLPLGSSSINSGPIAVIISEKTAGSDKPAQIARYEGVIQDLGGAKTFFFGPSGQVPPTVDELWRVQSVASTQDRKEAATVLLGWKTWVRADPTAMFQPEMRVAVEVMVNDHRAGTGSTIIGDGPVTDLLVSWLQ